MDNNTGDSTTKGTGGAPEKQGSGAGGYYKKKGTFRKPNVNPTSSVMIKEPKFEGRVPELMGHIYDCSFKQTDAYTRTTKEIAEYAGRTYKFGNDVRLAIEYLEAPQMDIPEDINEDTATKSETRIWEKRIDEYVKREEAYKQNLKTLYAVIWGQCTEALRAKLQAKDTHKAIAMAGNAIELLKNIKDTAFSFQGQKQDEHALQDAKRRYYSMFQDRNMSCQVYLERFRNHVQVIEHCGGAVVDLMMVIKMLPDGIEFDNATLEDMLNAQEDAKEKHLGTAFIVHADRSRYGKLIEDLENTYVQGIDRYPESLDKAYTLLMFWKHDPRNTARMLGSSSDGIAFAQSDSDDGTVFAQSGAPNDYNKPVKDLSHITCFSCNKKGHYASKCPKSKETQGAVHLQVASSIKTEVGHTLAQQDDSEEYEPDNITTSFQFHTCEDNPNETDGICQFQDKQLPASWIILDNGSTVDVFSNKKLLTNIRKSEVTMSIRCNAGVTKTNLQGDLTGYGTVWFNPKGIANILSLARVQEKHRVTYDSELDGKFVVHKPDGSVRVFDKSPSGLFYIDTSKTLDGVTMLATVADNKKSFTNREFEAARVARKLQNLIGRPSTKSFIDIVKKNLLKNCPINVRDILNAEVLFGPNVGSLKGKTTRRAANQVLAVNDNVPRHVMEQDRNVTICIDIMYVNKTLFLVSIARRIKFGTVEALINRKAGNIMSCVKNIHRIYSRRGFRLLIGIMDNEFEPLRAAFMDLGIELNISANDEHVPEVERYIRTIKERTRSIYNSLPYKSIPVLMIMEMVQLSVFWLNNFPATDGIYNDLSPRNIVVGSSIDYLSHCQIEFGAYAQVHQEHDNSMTARTTAAIALGPTGNAQGGYYFMSLDTGRRLNRNHWTELPAPAEVIDRVHVLARRSNANRGLVFADRDGYIMPEANLAEEDIHDDDDDSDYQPDVTPETDDDMSMNEADDADQDSVAVEEPNVQYIDHQGIQMPPDTAAPDHEEPNPMEHDQSSDGDADEYISTVDSEEPQENESESEDHQDPEDIHPEVADMDDVYGPRTGQYNLRPRKPRDFSHLHTALEATCMTQYSVKRGLKEFGDAGAAAVIKEMKQLDERGVIRPCMADSLTREEKHRALQYLMFLKKKRCGMIKGRGCADGRKQRLYKSKNETSAPTVAIESLMLSCSIDALERRSVTTADIPGAFMQADMDETVHMKIEGPLVDLLIQCDPDKYKKYTTIHNGKTIIYVMLEKALYGTLQAAYLFWKDFSGTLTSLGFILNPYDSCVANMEINGSQCTILWHVDDIKVSHIDEAVVDDIIDKLQAKYGKEAPLVVNKGTKHDYLGMTLDYSEVGKCKISMEDYILDILDDLPTEMAGFAVTPAAHHLFDVNEKAVPLNEEKSQFFHHNTAKLLFLSKRARPDIQTAVAFLTTRVTKPDQNDMVKLARVMKYLRGTPKLSLTLEANDMTVIKWWVDGSYAIHPDMRSHTGGTMSLGKGSVYSTSIRQKLNTKSSTEAELVGVADVMPQILWTRYFLQKQGYDVKTSMIYQDNQSAMLLEKNGRASSGKCTQHLNIRYFFVTDRINSKEVDVSYCPTGEMRGDFFTKPLQGALFRRFRLDILNME